jgi:4'-phosphopantetheinyl transferase
MRDIDCHWQSGSGPAALLESEVHVWRLSLDQGPRLIRLFEEFLSSEEKRRAEGSFLEMKKISFRLCRGFLRVLLGRFGGTAPEAIRFVKGERGKLHLDASFRRTGIEFNLSHSGDVALVALSKERRLGVDVEQTRPTAALDEISQRLFSFVEREEIGALPEAERIDGFYACWTRKESSIKALGGSIAELALEVLVTANPREPARLRRMPSTDSNAGPWQLQDLPVGEGYAAALCYQGRSAEVSLWDADAWLMSRDNAGT